MKRNFLKQTLLSLALTTGLSAMENEYSPIPEQYSATDRQKVEQLKGEYPIGESEVASQSLEKFKRKYKTEGKIVRLTPGREGFISRTTFDSIDQYLEQPKQCTRISRDY